MFSILPNNLVIFNSILTIEISMHNQYDRVNNINVVV